MLLMIKDLNLNENPKWISYEEFYNFLKIIIKKNYNDINDEKCEDTLIKIINELESSEFANNIEFFKNTNDNINNNSNSQVDIKNNINIKENIKNQIIEINDEEQNNNNNNKSDLSESSEMSENNSADNIINEDDNTIENLMENLNIEETDENLQDISNKENIYHLPLLKRIEKKNNIIVENILNELKNPKPTKRKVCYPKEFDEYEEEEEHVIIKMKKGVAKKKKK